MRLLCGRRTRVLITSRSLEAAAFCSSVRWNLLTPKIIRIESLSIWRDNERKPRILLLNYGWLQMTRRVRNISSAAHELVWSDVTASTWSILDCEQQVPLTNTLPYFTEHFQFERPDLSDSSVWTQRTVRFQIATHFFMHSASVRFIVSSQRGKRSNRICHLYSPWSEIIMVVQKFLLSRKTGRMSERSKEAKTQQYSVPFKFQTASLCTPRRPKGKRR